MTPQVDNDMSPPSGSDPSPSAPPTTASAARPKVTVPDGTRFDIEFAGKTVTLEAFLVTQAAAILIERHGLTESPDKTTGEPTIVASPTFLRDLAEEIFEGDPDAGGTEAYCAWQKAVALDADLKKKLNVMLN